MWEEILKSVQINWQCMAIILYDMYGINLQNLNNYVKYCFFFLFQFGFYKTFKEICTGRWKLAVFLTHSLIHKCFVNLKNNRLVWLVHCS